MQYKEDDLTAEIEADFSALTGLYPDTMTIVSQKSILPRPATPEEKNLIMPRIEAAMTFLGEKYELCSGHL
jgi:hypothetical protein